jgi:hypothetical protein
MATDLQHATHALAAALEKHLAWFQSTAEAFTADNEQLNRGERLDWPEFTARRKKVLNDLGDVVVSLREQRLVWEKLAAGRADQHPVLGPLLSANTNMIMKLVVLNREFEQLMLRHGLLPANYLPALPPQEPHFASKVYQRQLRS